MYEYDLFAVINHEGRLDNGHYTNLARYQNEVRTLYFCFEFTHLFTFSLLKWYQFDDEK